MNDLVREVSQMYAYFLVLRKPADYVYNLWTAIDVVAILFSQSFVWYAMATLRLNDMPEVFAAIVFSRWMQLMYSFRALKVADLGTKIIPILHSFFEIGGMVVITFFTSLAFLHAFILIDNRPIDQSANVALGTFKLLLIGGDDGIDTVL